MVQKVFGRVNTDATPPTLNANFSASSLATNGQPNGTKSEETATMETEPSSQSANGEEVKKGGDDSEAEKELKRQSLQDQIIAEAALARRETLNVADSKSPADILGDTEQVFEDESVPEALAGSSVQQPRETESQQVPTETSPSQEEQHQTEKTESENVLAAEETDAEGETITS